MVKRKRKKKKKKKEEEVFEDNSSDEETAKRQDSSVDLKPENVESTTPSSPSSSPSSSSSIIKQGFLEKKGVIRHNWTKRWMVMEGREIRYYAKENDPKGPRGAISLVNANLYPHVQKKKKDLPNYFNIRVNDRDFLIRAEDMQTKDEWVEAIRKSIVKEETKGGKLTKKASFLGVVKS